MKQLRYFLTGGCATMLVGASVLAQAQPPTSPQNLQPKTSPDPLVTSPQVVPRQPTTSPNVSPFSASDPPSPNATAPAATAVTDGDGRLNANTTGRVAPMNREDCNDWQKHGFKDQGACVASLTGGKERR